MKNKIAPIITIGLVGLITLAVIVLYFMPVNYMPTLSAPAHIQVYKNSSDFGTLNPGENKYTETWDAVNKSFTQNWLSAFFGGQTAVALNQTSTGELQTTTEAPNYNTKIVLDYNAGQQIVVQGVEQNVLINEVTFQVQNTTGYNQIKVYFKQVSSAGQKDTYYYMITYANQAELYKIVNSL